MNHMEERKLNELIVLMLEGKASDDQKKSLYSMLLESPVAIEHYIEYVSMVSSLLKADSRILSSFKAEIINQDDLSGLDEAKDSGFQIGTDSDTSIKGADISEFNLDEDSDDSKGSRMTQVMLELLELERTSAVVEIEKPEPVKLKRELIQKVESDFKWFPGRPSKRKIRTLLAMAASIMVLVCYLFFFASDSVERPVVAKLSDSIKAIWDNEFEVPDEFGDMVQSRYVLKEGFASIKFNDGAKVTVEAPAELSLNSAGDMELIHGRIYAIVPKKAHGFTVKAAASKIVDMGTEFGVEVDSNNNVQLHVTRGRTVLFSGLFDGSKGQTEVNEGSARKVYSDGLVKDIPVEKQKFVRIINSKSNLVLRDQKLNPADVVEGGAVSLQASATIDIEDMVLYFKASDPNSGVDSANWKSLTADSSKDWTFGSGITLENVTSTVPAITKAYRFAKTGVSGATWARYRLRQDATWEIWVKPSDTGEPYQTIFESGADGTGVSIWYTVGTQSDKTGTINFTIGSETHYETISAAIDTTEFRHIVLDFNNDYDGSVDRMKIYIDGVMVADNSATNPTNLDSWFGDDDAGLGNTSSGYIQKGAYAGAFTGDLAVLRFWQLKTALTDAKVAGLYSQNFD